MRRATAAVGVCSLLSLLGAATVFLAPSLFGNTAVETTARRNLGSPAQTKSFLSVAASALFLAGCVYAVRAGFGRSQDRGIVTDVADAVSGVSAATAGAQVDAYVEEIVASRSEGQLRSSDGVDGELRAELRSTATTVLMRSEGWDREAAETALETAEWTDDPRAGAFFGDGSYGRVARIRDFLGPRPTVERQVDAVLDELEARIDDEAVVDPLGRADLDGHGVDRPTGPGGDDGTVATGRVGDDELSALRSEGPTRVASRDAILVMAVAAATAGLLTATTPPLLVAVLGFGYALADTVTTAPAPAVEVQRELSDDDPLPGDLVEVTVQVTNTGDRPLPDLRVVDGVPGALPVVEGTPSLYTGLAPGSTDTLTYVLRAKRGEFAFEAVRVVSRSLGGSSEVVTSLDLSTRITCRTVFDELALNEQTLGRIGIVRGNEPGGGVEFYATREYQKGDPMNRIDWNHLAKANTLTTIQLREPRAASVVLVVDDRAVARVAPSETELDGVDLSVYAAERVFLTLLDRGNEVGLVTVDEQSGITPERGDSQRVRVQSKLRGATDRYAATLGSGSADGDGVGDTSRQANRIEQLIPAEAQVLLLSPATDEFVVSTTERLRARGHFVTLLSPATIGQTTFGERASRLERACRLLAIRAFGGRVVDWDPGEPVQSAVVRAIERWS
jgi:uncharacterized protein (DUF58 family)